MDRIGSIGWLLQLLLAPHFAVQVDHTDLQPGASAELHVPQLPTWRYSFDDGGARGTFQHVGGADVYTPADCVILGGGAQTVSIKVTASDRITGFSTSHDVALKVACPAATFFTTKTPYHPHQDAATYEAAPAGFTPVFTQLVARHGSRGLSSAKYDLASYAMWQQAQADGALTELGQQLGPDLLQIIRANALLGAGVAGIKNFGYGNLTQLGIREHTQLAQRMYQRQSALLSAPGSRKIEVVSSGVDRAVDSAGFFTQSLAAQDPDLPGALESTPALTAYPVNAPVAQAAATNRFQLYFHKLAAKTDLPSEQDPYYATYQASLAYQAYLSDPDMNGMVDTALEAPEVEDASREVLERLFAKSFVDKIADGTYKFANTGSFTFRSDDGKTTTTVTGDSKTKVASLSDAASMLYNVYAITPSMVSELGLDFTRYFPADAAESFAFLDDLTEFYEAGPSIAERAPVTYAMAKSLQDDFFAEVDAVAAGNLAHLAKLRFTHAEIIIPFAAIMGLANKSESLPLADTYSYANSGFRGELVSPLTANVQWDVLQNRTGQLIVKQLYNEQETDFASRCEGARIRPGSHYYDYAALKRCYAR